MYSSKCIILLVFFYTSCAFVSGQLTLGLNGTWIVRNTSDVDEIMSCPFILIKTKPQNTNFSIEYQSLNQNATFNASQISPSTYRLFELNEAVGNLTFVKENLPFYIIMNISITQETPWYMVVTKRYNVSKVVDNEISAFLSTTNPSKPKVTLNATRHGTPECRTFLGIYDKEANSPYPNVIPEEIPTNTKLPPMHPTTQKPMMTHKPSNKPNNGSNGHAPDIIIFITSVICLILMK